MNISPMARGYMRKAMDGEKFLLHVAEVIERQLKEWDPGYEVNVLKLADYELWVKKDEDYLYEVNISEFEVGVLQKEGSYRLDVFIWKRLEEQGLAINKDYGNYLKTILR